MTTRNMELSLELISAERKATSEGEEEVAFQTNAGRNKGRLHPVDGADLAIVWVFGAGGGLGGPAGGAYHRLAKQMKEKKVASLELDYRHAGHLEHCIADVLLAVSYLKSLDLSRFILVGHSFGGAVVISAGAISNDVIGVAALSSQTYGTYLAGKLSPKPLLLIHGTGDEVLPYAGSAEIYKRANQPKEIIYYEGCRHGLDQCTNELDRDLMKWLNKVINS